MASSTGDILQARLRHSQILTCFMHTLWSLHVSDNSISRLSGISIVYGMYTCRTDPLLLFSLLSIASVEILCPGLYIYHRYKWKTMQRVHGYNMP